MWEKYPPVTIRKGLIAYFRYSIGRGTMFIQKYINLYFNKILQKRVANAIQTNRLFLGEVKRIAVLYGVSLAYVLLVII